MKRISPFLSFFLFVAVVASAQTDPALPLLKTAEKHPMMYYLALPKGWTAAKKWPVLVVLEAAEKEFKKNADRFAEARGDQPYILIAPINVNNGFDGRKDPKLWPYSKRTWDFIDSVGDCAFNQDGILAVVNEVTKKYNGEDKFYITGFEAGTHALWPMVFEHPEKLKAAIAVAGNYNRNTCVGKQVYSTAKEREQLPVIGMYGEKDPYYGNGGIAFNQWNAAKKMAEDHGFKNVTEKIIKGKDHVPMPVEVFEAIRSIQHN